jgi:hypothetical protein
MFRRARRSVTSLDHRQEELSQRESELRNEVERLERLIAAAPRVAEETSRRQREELLRRAQTSRSRLEVSVALQDKRYGEEDAGPRRRGSLRKARREGRLVFLILTIALAVAVVWLATHLHF